MSQSSDTGARLQRQLRFIRELDRLKSVLRRTSLIDRSRLENSAEHSWHLTAMALSLFEYAPAGADLTRTLEMLIVHDVVEIDAGDRSRSTRPPTPTRRSRVGRGNSLVRDAAAGRRRDAPRVLDGVRSR